MKNVSFSVEFDGADLVGRLYRLTGETSSKPSILGKAVAAGAKVVYDEIHKNVPFRTGLLKKSVYRFFDPALSPSAHKIAYRVGVNVTKAPHWWIVEHGHNLYKGQRIVPVGGGEYRTLGGKKRKRKQSANAGQIIRHIGGKSYLEKSWNASRGKAMETIWATYARIAMETINGRNVG